MRAVVIHAARDLRVEERPEMLEPSDAMGPGKVRVRVERGGICGSDLHYYLHGGVGSFKLREPMVLGHEVAGVIEEVGGGVEGLAVGDRVAVSPSRPDWTDSFSREGMPIHSHGMRFYGSALLFPHVQGAFRDTLIADAAQCAPIAPQVSAGAAAMTEPLAVCLHAARRAGPLLGKRVLVTGSGPIGVLCVMCARRAGATEIVATDLADRPLAFAEAAGADATLNLASDPDALSRYSHDKGRFHVMFEATGVEAALTGAFAAVRPQGVIVQVGLGEPASLPLTTIVAKELEIRGAFRFHEEFDWAATMLNQGLIDVAPLITHCFGVDEAQTAFDVAADRSRAMKAQLAFS